MARNPPLIGSPLFSSHLTGDDVYSSQHPHAKIPRVLGGHTRAYYEHAVGATIGEQTAIAPRNPRGQIGEDHSGAGWGRGSKHSFWYASFCDSGHVVSGASTAPAHHETAPRVNVAAPTTAVKGRVESWTVYIPPCWPGGAYDTVQLDAVIFCESITGGPYDIDVGLEAYDWYSTDAVTVTISAAAASTYYSGSTTVTGLPSQSMYARVWIQAPAAATVDVELCCLSLSQVS